MHGGPKTSSDLVCPTHDVQLYLEREESWLDAELHFSLLAEFSAAYFQGGESFLKLQWA